MAPVVFDELLTSDKLPSPPAIVSKILILSDDPNASLRDYSNLISCDVGLVVQLIKVANSAYYCARSPVVDIDRAINVIGLSAIVPLAVSFSMKGLMNANNSPLDLDPFWRRSVLLSSVSAFLSDYASGVSREEALLAGLLQDFGILAVSTVYPDKYRDAQEFFASDHDKLITIEEEQIGLNHSIIGSSLLGSWGFPPSITESVLCSHHGPDETHRDLKWCVSGANIFVTQVMQGLGDHSLWDELHRILRQDWLNLPADAVDSAVLILLEIISATEQLFDVQVFSDDDMSTILPDTE